MDRNVTLNYNSTLEGSVLLLTCEDEFQMSLNSTNEMTLENNSFTINFTASSDSEIELVCKPLLSPSWI